MTYSEADKKSINYFLKRLNGFLEAEYLQMAVFDRTLQRFVKRFNPKIGLIDFKYFDEQRLMKVRKKMIKQERLQNFGYLQNLSKLEQICLNYIELRKLFNFEKSVFIYEENYLLYCYCGTSFNDRQIMLWIALDERYVELKIKI
jgi:hypothetical protein